MLTRTVYIKNTSDETQVLKHIALRPLGFVEVLPGEVIPVPVEVWSTAGWRKDWCTKVGDNNDPPKLVKEYIYRLEDEEYSESQVEDKPKRKRKPKTVED